MDIVLKNYLAVLGIDSENITTYDVRRLLELVCDRDNRLYCQDDNYPGVYHIYEISDYRAESIEFNKFGIYHPVYGVLNTPDEVDNFNSIDDIYI
jgi:hypothetical protein